MSKLGLLAYVEFVDLIGAVRVGQVITRLQILVHDSDLRGTTSIGERGHYQRCL